MQTTPACPAAVVAPHSIHDNLERLLPWLLMSIAQRFAVHAQLSLRKAAPLSKLCDIPELGAVRVLLSHGETSSEQSRWTVRVKLFTAHSRHCPSAPPAKHSTCCFSFIFVRLAVPRGESPAICSHWLFPSLAASISFSYWPFSIAVLCVSCSH